MNLSPHVYVFEKRDPALKAPTHVISFYFLNYIFSIVVPFNKKDFWFYGQELEPIPYPPLFVAGSDIMNLKVDPFSYHFSSEEKHKGTEQEITFQMNKSDLEKAVGIDANTNFPVEPVNFDSKNIVKLILVEKGGEIQLPIDQKEAIWC